MKLDEAIMYLETPFANRVPYSPEKSSEAKRLGIEAIKVIQMERRDSVSYAGELLPGETDYGGIMRHWCPFCQQFVETYRKSYKIKWVTKYKSLRTETICAKCGLTISTLTQELP